MFAFVPPPYHFVSDSPSHTSMAGHRAQRRHVEEKAVQVVALECPTTHTMPPPTAVEDLRRPMDAIHAYKSKHIIVQSRPTVSRLTSGTSSIRFQDVPDGPGDAPTAPGSKTQSLAQTHPSDLSLVEKHEELLSFARAWLYSKKAGLRHSSPKPLSAYGSFVNQTIEPLYEWFGRNKRVVSTAALCNVGLQEGSQVEYLLNGTSFNYAGAYTMPPEYKALQHKCLDYFPYADRRAVGDMYRSMLEDIATFMGADCAFATSTGYTSNMALVGLVDDSWAVFTDEKAHNSIFTGSYLADAGDRRKFPHNDMAALEMLLQAERKTNVMVVIEGLYRYEYHVWSSIVLG
jgi:hypothetical protein